MYELDREKFGSFIAQLRKEKGYTQKELAEKLSISDKAVSKWETGKSLPDISLLVPLAYIMEVTVTELLEARRIEGAQITAVPVEDMVKKALTYSEESQEKSTRLKVKHCILCGAGILAGLLEVWGLILLTKGTDFLSLYSSSSVFCLEGLCILFGIYFWIFAKEKIPSFYDENKLNFYSDGVFRINVPSFYTRFGTTEGLNGEVTALYRYRDRLYAGTLHGLFLYAPESDRFVQLPAITQSCWQLKESPQGDLYAVTSNGLFQINGNRAKAINDYNTFSLTFDPKDSHVLYTGEIDGVYRITGSRKEKIADVEKAVQLAFAADRLWAETLYGELYQWGTDLSEPVLQDSMRGIQAIGGNKLYVIDNTIQVLSRYGFQRWNAATNRAGFPSTCRAGGAKTARATASSKSRCTFCRTCTCPARSAAVNGTTGRRWRSSTRERAFTTC